MHKDQDKYRYSEDGLERFFQKGTQDYEFEFREEDWEKLAIRLEEEKPAFPLRTYLLRLGLVVVGLLLILGGAWRFYQQAQPRQVPQVQNKQITLSYDEDFPRLNQEDEKVTHKQQDGSRAEVFSSSPDQEASGTKSVEKHLPEDKSLTRPSGKPSDRITTSATPPASRNAQEQLIIVREKPRVVDPSWLALPSGLPSSSREPEPAVYEIREPDEVDVLEKPLVASLTAKGLDQAIPSLALDSSAVEELFVNPPESSISEKGGFSPWSLSLSLAPDLSSVGISDYTDPGQKIGLSVEYAISRRWRISVGALYATKKYQAGAEAYEVPEGFWYSQANGNIPETIAANCKVIDIPLNVKFYLKPEGRHRFYASTGLSSYLLLREDYQYDYGVEDTKSWPTEWHISNENRHFFGLANFSLGYEFSLNPNWALQVEPFLKTPLSRVGWGRVNLYSVGTFVNLKYQFSRKR